MDIETKKQLFRTQAQKMGFSVDDIAMAEQIIGAGGDKAEKEAIALESSRFELEQKKKTPEELGEEEALTEITKKKALKRAGIGLETEVSAEEKKQQKKLRDVASAVDQLEENYNQLEVKGPWVGDVAKLFSGITRGKMNPQIRDYEALRKSMIGPLARTISGEVGVLTDRDIARAEDLLPKVEDAPEVVKNKLYNLRRRIGEMSGTKTEKKRPSLEELFK